MSVRRRNTVLVLVAAGALAAAPGEAGAARNLALAVVHTVRGCHVWRTTTSTPGPTANLTVPRGSTLRIRVSCPMDFDLRQTAGPVLRLGGRRLYAGTTRSLLFTKPGVYRLTAKNVQTSDEQGLETLGPDNTLQLTVRVR